MQVLLQQRYSSNSGASTSGKNDPTPGLSGKGSDELLSWTHVVVDLSWLLFWLASGPHHVPSCTLGFSHWSTVTYSPASQISVLLAPHLMCLLIQQQHLKLAGLLLHLALPQPHGHVPEACSFAIMLQTACLSPNDCMQGRLGRLGI